MQCRHCKSTLNKSLIDLGFAPPSNSYLHKEDLSKPEKYFPLRVLICSNCWLVQTDDYTDAKEIFNSNYAYFSSTSTSWLEHSKRYVNDISKRLNLTTGSFVVELACNDGYLLKNFVDNSVQCLGIEPTQSTAFEAQNLNIPVIMDFFTEKLSKKIVDNSGLADLVIGNNVFAHVPQINDFTSGIRTILAPNGTVTLEFPHLLNLIQDVQFDTIYHEHFSYLSLTSVSNIFASHDLRIYDVDEIGTHGGSLRIYGCHKNAKFSTSKAVKEVLIKEKRNGLLDIRTYENFQFLVDKIKYELIEFLIKAKIDKKKVVAYGAAAKGNTLLNYAGIKSDLIECVFDAAEAKQGMYMPGSHIPIVAPDKLMELSPDIILILPWNIKDEIKTVIRELVSENILLVVPCPKIEKV